MTAFEIAPLPPFRLVPTVRALQRLPSNMVDVLEDGRYFRVLPTAAGPRLLIVEDAGSVDRPLLRVSVAGDSLDPTESAGLRTTVSEMLGAAVDIAPFYRIACDDPRLRAAVTSLRGLKPPRFPTIFETIVNTVVFQQITLAAAVAIVGRIVERLGTPLDVDGRRYYAFPRPQSFVAATADELRAFGLSARKAEVLRHLASLVLAGDLSFEALRPRPGEEAIKVLSALPGIGRWTAEVILLRGLGRLDVFPTGDTGVRRGLARVLGRDQSLTAADERPLLDHYGPWRGLLYFFSLGWRLLRLGLIEPAQ